MKQDKHIYRRLQRHLDTMPVGYPRTITGIELKILQRMFSPFEAEIALFMTFTFETAGDIYKKINSSDLTVKTLSGHLDQMGKNGLILVRTTGAENLYALVPFLIGMYEFQTKKLTADFYNDTISFFKQGFAVDYLSTAVPQMRVIPVERSIPHNQKIATYNEIRKIINKADSGLSIVDCVCKKAQDLVEEPCKKTKLREVCIALRDYNDTYVRNGWGRPISKDEAFEILDKAEKDGLIIQTANEQEPQFICACCDCCCGILSLMSAVPRPIDFAATNYMAQLDHEACVGCGLCVKRCNMAALEIIDKKAVLKEEKCIGCGLCIGSCKPGALKLLKKEEEIIPPADTEELYDTIMKKKNSRFKRWYLVIKAFLGFKVKMQ